jgi:hypothetical protein
MSDAQNLSGGEALDKVKDLAKEHPDEAKAAIDKLEQTLDEKTGGRFRDVLDKGGEYLEKEFGIPSDTSSNPPEQTPPPTQPQPEPPTDPSQAPEPPQQPGQPNDPSQAPQPPDPTQPEQPQQPADPSVPEPTPDQAPTTPDKQLPPFGN